MLLVSACMAFYLHDLHHKRVFRKGLPFVVFLIFKRGSMRNAEYENEKPGCTGPGRPCSSWPLP